MLIATASSQRFKAGQRCHNGLNERISPPGIVKSAVSVSASLRALQMSS